MGSEPKVTPTDREMLREKRQLSESLEQAIRSLSKPLDVAIKRLLGEVARARTFLGKAPLSEAVAMADKTLREAAAQATVEAEAALEQWKGSK